MENNYQSYRIAKQSLINRYSDKNSRLRRASNNLDSFVTIDNFLDNEFSVGYLAKPDKINYNYQHWENINNYIKILIKDIKFREAVCIPDTVIKYDKYIIRNGIVYYPIDNILVIPNEIIDTIKRCQNNKRYIYFNLVINWNDSNSHANMIIIDLFNKTVERFEPQGKFYGHSSYSDAEINKKIIEALKHIELNDYKYIPPTKLSPPNGLQSIADAYNGMCVTYCLIYLHLRIMNPDVKQREIVDYLIKKKSTKLIEILLRYTSYIEKALKKNKKQIIKEYDDLFGNKSKDMNDYIIINKYGKIERDRF
jgi:hypothetical protein